MSPNSPDWIIALSKTSLDVHLVSFFSLLDPIVRRKFQRSSLPLQCIPLLGSIALWSPSVNGSNLSLQDRVHEAMTSKHVLAFKLGRHDHSLESLSTAAYIRHKY